MIDICEIIDGTKKYYIYGTLYFGKYCCDRLTECYGEDIVIGFIESDPKFDECLGRKIFTPEQIKGKIDDSIAFIITGFKNYNVMKNNLLACGVAENNIFILKQYKPYFRPTFKEPIKKICYWPPIESKNNDLSKKIGWFIPDRIEVIVFSSDNSLKCDFRENVIFENENNKECIFEQVDCIYLWDMSQNYPEVEKYENKIHVVDPEFYLYVEIVNYNKLYYYSLSDEEKESYIRHSVDVFLKMKKECKEYTRANIFCSGPSIEEVYDMEFDNSFNVICNSMVKDKELLKKITPKLLVYADVIFYISPSDYCFKFYEDVIEGIRNYDFYIVVFDYQKPLLCKLFPEIKERLIGITPKSNDVDKTNFPDENNFYIRDTANIMTMLMLPFASAMCDEIGIAGCTGRSVNENYYWKHNDRAQYQDLMQSVFEMYPAAFRNTKYDDYYKRHCQIVKQILEYGEAKGKRYLNLSTSFIEALKDRTV